MNTVICEAQSWSRPVIGTRVGGNSDLIREGETGYLCEPGDVTMLQRRMEELLHDDALADRLGREGFSHIGQYSMEKHVDNLLELYGELLAEDARQF